MMSALNARGKKGIGALGLLYQVCPLRNFSRLEKTARILHPCPWLWWCHAVPLSRLRYIPILWLNLASTRVDWEMREQDGRHSRSEQNFHKWPCFGSASCPFSVPWGQLSFRDLGAGTSSRPTSANWHEQETEMFALARLRFWSDSCSQADQHTLFPERTLEVQWSSKLPFYLNIGFSLTRLTQSTTLDYATGELQLISSDFNVDRLKRNLSGNCISRGPWISGAKVPRPKDCRSICGKDGAWSPSISEASSKCL